MAFRSLGWPTYLSTGALVVLILVGNILFNSPSPERALGVNQHGASKSNIELPSTHVKYAAATAQRRAIPFGSKTALLCSNSSDQSRIQHAGDKRATFPDSVPWVNAVAEGAKLQQQLNSGPFKPTPFMQKSDMCGPASLTPPQIKDGLGKGWVVSEGEHDTPPGYETVFGDLNIPEGDANFEQDADQNVPFVNCKRQLNKTPTGGKNYAFYNVKGKTIVSANNYSPSYMLKDSHGGILPEGCQTMLPDVQRWSDITWILWDEIAGSREEAYNLKYIFKHDVVTDSTRRIMELAVPGTAEDQLDAPWPGITFEARSHPDSTDNQFVALLGTPHGRGVVYFLTQHPEQLPGKTLESITVFTTDDFDYGYHLLFTLSGPGNDRIEGTGLAAWPGSPIDSSGSSSSHGSPKSPPG